MVERKDTVVGIIESVCDQICNDYCKYREQWNEEEHDGLELCDSEICDACPLNKLQ